MDWRELDSDDERRISAEIDEQFKKAPPPKWDAESILSTRTNHENHPTELRVNVSRHRSGSKLEAAAPGTVGHGVRGLPPLEPMAEDESESESEHAERTGPGGGGTEFSFGRIGGNGGGGDVVAQREGDRVVFEFTAFEDAAERDEKADDVVMREDVAAHSDDAKERGVATVPFAKRRGETKEQKRERKRLQKEMKQRRKKEKKANKMAFKAAEKINVKMGVTQRRSHGNALRL